MSEGSSEAAQLSPKSVALKAFGALKEMGERAVVNTSQDTIFSTLEDFQRADPSLKRLLVIGCTGAGKSTLLNLLAGWTFVGDLDAAEFDFSWVPRPSPSDAGDAAASGEEEEEPLFSTEAGSESCTKKTSYANLSWFGDRGKPFTAIDTPGHDDPDGADIDSPEAREALGEIAADLHNKLRAIKKVNAILVLHNDVHSNRLNPATYTILKMVAEKFAAAGDGGDVWKHVILAYAKCNSHDVSWQASIAKKKRDLQAAVRAKIPSCKVEVPVVTLGGATVSGEGAGAMAAAGKAKEKEGFDELWTFLQTAGDLDCTKLQPFEGADVKWEKMIKAKDEAEARARASLIYIAVLAKLGGFLVFLFWRAFMLPRYVAFLLASAIGAYAVHQIVTCSGDVPRTPLFGAALALLMVNMHTVADELLILGLFVKFVGYETMAYSVRHSYRVWLEPHAGPFVDAAMEKAGPLLQAAQEQVKKLTVSVAPPAKPSAETKKNL